MKPRKKYPPPTETTKWELSIDKFDRVNDEMLARVEDLMIKTLVPYRYSDNILRKWSASWWGPVDKISGDIATILSFLATWERIMMPHIHDIFATPSPHTKYLDFRWDVRASPDEVTIAIEFQYVGLEGSQPSDPFWQECFSNCPICIGCPRAGFFNLYYPSSDGIRSWVTRDKHFLAKPMEQLIEEGLFIPFEDLESEDLESIADKFPRLSDEMLARVEELMINTLVPERYSDNMLRRGATDWKGPVGKISGDIATILSFLATWETIMAPYISEVFATPSSHTKYLDFRWHVRATPTSVYIDLELQRVWLEEPQPSDPFWIQRGFPIWIGCPRAGFFNLYYPSTDKIRSWVDWEKNCLETPTEQLEEKAFVFAISGVGGYFYQVVSAPRALQGD